MACIVGRMAAAAIPSARARIMRPGILRSMVLLLVICGFLGHIVPLSLSGHTPFTTPTDSHSAAHGGADGSHVASCDAMTARTTATSPLAGGLVGVVAPPSSVIPCTVAISVSAVVARASWHHTGPPLFLLHAAFLI